MRSPRCCCAVCAAGVRPAAPSPKRPTATSRSTFTSDDGEVNYEKRSRRAQRQRRHHAGHADHPAPTASTSSRTPTTRCRPPPSATRSPSGRSATAPNEYYEGWAQRAEYDGAKEQLELFDNAHPEARRGTRSAATTSPTTPPPSSSRPRAARHRTAGARATCGQQRRACAAPSSPRATSCRGKAGQHAGAEQGRAADARSPSGELAPAAK